MKINVTTGVGIMLLATLATGFATRSLYSGIYNVNTGVPTLVAITKAGYMLSLSDNTTFREELTPAKSRVGDTGKVLGSTASGVTMTAQIASDFTVTGTVKSGGFTQRITGKRILK